LELLGKRRGIRAYIEKLEYYIKQNPTTIQSRGGILLEGVEVILEG
jgi:hypothetical protein